MEFHNPRPLKSLKPIFQKFFSNVALGWVLASGALAASGYPEGGDGRGLSIKLEVPWTTFKIGEKLVFRYTLQNASHKPIPIAIPFEKYGLGSLTGGQAFLEPVRTGGRKAENSDYDVRTAPWPPRTALEDEEPQAWTWLAPGQQLTWNQNQLWAGHYGVGCYQSFEGFRGHWLSGPNQWISSDPVKVEIVSVPQPEWTELFKVQWTSTGYRGGPREGTVYRIPIKGKMYLFFDGPFRIAEVEQDEQFEHSIDKDGTNLEITIKGAAGSRRVYFHLAQGYTRDTPWPIGPVSLFDPKPEPIPPAELEALRRTAASAAQSPIAEERPDRKSGPRAPSDSPAVVADDGTGAWFWTVVGLIILMCSIAFVMSRKLLHPRA
jgi:hypothetical protein